MKRMERRRIWMSRILLAVFVPMLLFSVLHIHTEGAEMNDACSECIHHVRHSHLSSADFCIDQCVLCQFLTLPFIVAGLMILGITLVVRLKRWQGIRFHHPASTAGYISLRAPPCFCLN